jgi:hypothetical protein
MKENHWIVLWMSVLVSLVIIVVASQGIYTYKSIRMAELGFQDTAYQGSMTSYYQKVK